MLHKNKVEYVTNKTAMPTTEQICNTLVIKKLSDACQYYIFPNLITRNSHISKVRFDFLQHASNVSGFFF